METRGIACEMRERGRGARVKQAALRCDGETASHAAGGSRARGWQRRDIGRGRACFQRCGTPVRAYRQSQLPRCAYFCDTRQRSSRVL